MIGRIIITDPPITRWGDGSLGNITIENDTNMGNGNWYAKDGSGYYTTHWSKRVYRGGLYQADTITIPNGTHIETHTPDSHAVPRKLILFARKEIIIGTNVLINAGVNNFYRQSSNWKAFDGNYTGTLAQGTGGGGGGGGGSNNGSRVGGTGGNGSDPALWFTKNRGVTRGSAYYNPGSAVGGKGNVGRSNGPGRHGGAGWPSSNGHKNGIKNEIAKRFGFTTRTNTNKGDGVDDFPLWIGGMGGDGGEGGRHSNNRFTTGGNGGRGGGSVILVAPKITIASGHLNISIAGNTRGNGCDNNRHKDGWHRNYYHRNMNGASGNKWDGGSGAGGAGGGGFCGIVTTPGGLTGGIIVNGLGASTGGQGKTHWGNRGGDGGNGGAGVYMIGEKPLISGPIQWKVVDGYTETTGIDGNA